MALKRGVGGVFEEADAVFADGGRFVAVIFCVEVGGVDGAIIS